MVEYLGFARFQNHQPDLKRCIPTVLLSHKTLFTALCFVGFASVVIWQRSIGDGLGLFFGAPLSPCSSRHPVAFNLTDFGGVGDGVTLNTKAFESAIKAIAKNRGGQLNVQAGVWLTAPFNLTSHMTLFLEEGAIIRGFEVSSRVSIIVVVFSICSLASSDFSVVRICQQMYWDRRNPHCWREHLLGPTKNSCFFLAIQMLIL